MDSLTCIHNILTGGIFVLFCLICFLVNKCCCGGTHKVICACVWSETSCNELFGGRRHRLKGSRYDDYSRTTSDSEILTHEQHFHGGPTTSGEYKNGKKGKNGKRTSEEMEEARRQKYGKDAGSTGSLKDGKDTSSDELTKDKTRKDGTSSDDLTKDKTRKDGTSSDELTKDKRRKDGTSSDEYVKGRRKTQDRLSDEILDSKIRKSGQGMSSDEVMRGKRKGQTSSDELLEAKRRKEGSASDEYGESETKKDGQISKEDERKGDGKGISDDELSKLEKQKYDQETEDEKYRDDMDKYRRASFSKDQYEGYDSVDKNEVSSLSTLHGASYQDESENTLSQISSPPQQYVKIEVKSNDPNQPATVHIVPKQQFETTEAHDLITIRFKKINSESEDELVVIKTKPIGSVDEDQTVEIRNRSPSKSPNNYFTPTDASVVYYDPTQPYISTTDLIDKQHSKDSSKRSSSEDKPLGPPIKIRLKPYENNPEEQTFVLPSTPHHHHHHHGHLGSANEPPVPIKIHVKSLSPEESGKSSPHKTISERSRAKSGHDHKKLPASVKKSFVGSLEAPQPGKHSRVDVHLKDDDAGIPEQILTVERKSSDSISDQPEIVISLSKDETEGSLPEILITVISADEAMKSGLIRPDGTPTVKDASTGGILKGVDHRHVGTLADSKSSHQSKKSEKISAISKTSDKDKFVPTKRHKDDNVDSSGSVKFSYISSEKPSLESSKKTVTISDEALRHKDSSSDGKGSSKTTEEGFIDGTLSSKQSSGISQPHASDTCPDGYIMGPDGKIYCVSCGQTIREDVLEDTCKSRCCICPGSSHSQQTPLSRAVVCDYKCPNLKGKQKNIIQTQDINNEREKIIASRTVATNISPEVQYKNIMEGYALSNRNERSVGARAVSCQVMQDKINKSVITAEARDRVYCAQGRVSQVTHGSDESDEIVEHTIKVKVRVLDDVPKTNAQDSYMHTTPSGTKIAIKGPQYPKDDANKHKVLIKGQPPCVSCLKNARGRDEEDDYCCCKNKNHSPQPSTTRNREIGGNDKMNSQPLCVLCAKKINSNFDQTTASNRSSLDTVERRSKESPRLHEQIKQNISKENRKLSEVKSQASSYSGHLDDTYLEYDRNTGQCKICNRNKYKQDDSEASNSSYHTTSRKSGSAPPSSRRQREEPVYYQPCKQSSSPCKRICSKGRDESSGRRKRLDSDPEASNEGKVTSNSILYGKDSQFPPVTEDLSSIDRRTPDLRSEDGSRRPNSQQDSPNENSSRRRVITASKSRCGSASCISEEFIPSDEDVTRLYKKYSDGNTDYSCSCDEIIRRLYAKYGSSDASQTTSGHVSRSREKKSTASSETGMSHPYYSSISPYVSRCTSSSSAKNYNMATVSNCKCTKSETISSEETNDNVPPNKDEDKFVSKFDKSLDQVQSTSLENVTRGWQIDIENYPKEHQTTSMEVFLTSSKKKIGYKRPHEKSEPKIEEISSGEKAAAEIEDTHSDDTVTSDGIPKKRRKIEDTSKTVGFRNVSDRSVCKNVICKSLSNVDICDDDTCDVICEQQQGTKKPSCLACNKFSAQENSLDRSTKWSATECSACLKILENSEKRTEKLFDDISYIDLKSLICNCKAKRRKRSSDFSKNRSADMKPLNNLVRFKAKRSGPNSYRTFRVSSRVTVKSRCTSSLESITDTEFTDSSVNPLAKIRILKSEAPSEPFSGNSEGYNSGPSGSCPKDCPSIILPGESVLEYVERLRRNNIIPYPTCYETWSIRKPSSVFPNKLPEDKPSLPDSVPSLPETVFSSPESISSSHGTGLSSPKTVFSPPETVSSFPETVDKDADKKEDRDNDESSVEEKEGAKSTEKGREDIDVSEEEKGSNIDESGEENYGINKSEREESDIEESKQNEEFDASEAGTLGNKESKESGTNEENEDPSQQNIMKLLSDGPSSSEGPDYGQFYPYKSPPSDTPQSKSSFKKCACPQVPDFNSVLESVQSSDPAPPPKSIYVRDRDNYSPSNNSSNPNDSENTPASCSEHCTRFRKDS